MRFHILIFLSLVLAFAACEKDSTTEIVTFTETTLSGETVTANFYGQLTNDQGVVVQGAEVRIGNKQTTTDQEGLWSIDNATVVKDQAFIQFAADRHHKGSRTLFVEESNTYEVDVEMLQFTGTSTVEATAGGTVDVAGTNASVSFPAAAFSSMDGTPYTGTVRVEAAYLDPNSPDMGNQMPGDLRATTAEGESRLLISYGMLSVELFDDAGNEVQLSDGQRATLTMPIEGDAAATAPETIPLWYFDEASAQWIEEGLATKQGNAYVGDVTHFTFWNCDIPTEYIRLCGTVVFEGVDSTTAANLRLVIESQNWGNGYGYTDANGQFCGIVPANETLTFIVGGVCGVPIYSVTIGPYASDTDLGTVIVPLPQNLLTTVSGTASCNGVPLTSGAVRVLQNGSLVATTTIEPDGSFSTDYVSCDTSEVTVRVVNYATLEVGEATFTYSNAINTGDIGACTMALTNFFELTFDGMTFVGDSCNFYADGGELGLYGSYIGSNNVFGNLGFSLFDPSLPMPIVVGTYTAPPSATNPNGTTRGASLNLNGFPGVPDFNYDVSSFPYEITAVGNQTSPYTTGTIGPGTVQLLDSAGTVISTHTLEIDFSAYNF